MGRGHPRHVFKPGVIRVSSKRFLLLLVGRGNKRKLTEKSCSDPTMGQGWLVDLSTSHDKMASKEPQKAPRHLHGQDSSGREFTGTKYPP